MTLLNGVGGPEFGAGDLAIFTIDGTEVTMRLLNIPHNTGVIDDISRDRLIDVVSGDEWYPGGADRATRDIVTQSWNYMDEVTNVNMATCFFKLRLVENLQEETENQFCLNSEKFKAHILNELACEEPEPAQDASDDLPSKKNNFLAKDHDRLLVDWLQVQVELEVGKAPFPALFIPVSQRFFISASLKLQPINYDDVESRFSEAQLREFMFKVFDEFVENTSVTYSLETIEKIESIKT